MVVTKRIEDYSYSTLRNSITLHIGAGTTVKTELIPIREHVDHLHKLVGKNIDVREINIDDGPIVYEWIGFSAVQDDTEEVEPVPEIAVEQVEQVEQAMAPAPEQKNSETINVTVTRIEKNARGDIYMVFEHRLDHRCGVRLDYEIIKQRHQELIDNPAAVIGKKITVETIPDSINYKFICFYMDEQPEPVTTDKQPNVLQEAQELVTGARAEAYGDIKENFDRIAMLWLLQLEQSDIDSLKGALRCLEQGETHAALAHNVTVSISKMHIATKLGRNANTYKRDNMVDTPGYCHITDVLHQAED